MLKHSTSSSSSTPSNGVIAGVRALQAQLIEAIRAGRLDEARDLVRQQQLPPIAWGYLASLLQQQDISADIIEQILT